MSAKKSQKNSNETKSAAKPAAKPAQAPAARKLSLLSAAAAVLAESEEPLNCRQMIELAKRRQLWAPGGGKTPEQTLYSAIAREIKSKGEASRFRPSPVRGHYLPGNAAS